MFGPNLFDTFGVDALKIISASDNPKEVLEILLIKVKKSPNGHVPMSEVKSVCESYTTKQIPDRKRNKLVAHIKWLFCELGEWQDDNLITSDISELFKKICVERYNYRG